MDLIQELAADSAPVVVDAPEQVEVIVGRSAAGLVVHLLNHSGQRRNGFGPVVPISAVHIRVPGAVGRSARVLGSTTELQSGTDGDDLRVDLGPLREFAVVVIEDADHDA